MGHQIQSPVSLNDVVFIEATPEQRTLAWTLNGASWATPMSVPEYVARETYLSQQALTKNGLCKYWVVHPRDKPDEILSGCEATPKTVLIAGGGQGFRTASSYGIASVYTNPLYRRQGLAAMMLKKLQAWMDSENAACSALYSDIGVTFYANLGWEVFPSDEVSIFTDPNKASLAMLATTRFLKKEDFRALCDEDVSRLTAQFKALENDEKIHVAFCPTYEQLCWHFGRDEFMGRAIHSRDVVNRGAISQDGKAWICWDHDFREGKMKVQRIVLLDHDSPSQRANNLQNLLQAALAEAADWDLKKVVVWNPDEETRQAALAIGDRTALDVVFSRREVESIPSLRWKNGENLEAVWEENQYYAWC